MNTNLKYAEVVPYGYNWTIRDYRVSLEKDTLFFNEAGNVRIFLTKRAAQTHLTRSSC